MPPTFLPNEGDEVFLDAGGEEQAGREVFRNPAEAGFSGGWCGDPGPSNWVPARWVRVVRRAPGLAGP